eukprot:Skav219357  [mRNA]  locus=scaffold76:500390:505839:- [translate_table: standard]
MVVLYVVSFELVFFLACVTHTRKRRKPLQRTKLAMNHHRSTKQRGKWLFHARRCGTARHRQVRQAAHRLRRLRRRQWQFTCKAIITRKMTNSPHIQWSGTPAAQAVFLSPPPDCSNTTSHPGWVGGKGDAATTAAQHRQQRKQQEEEPPPLLNPQACNKSNAQTSWVGGKGGAAAAATRRKQQHRQFDEEPTLLEAVEATIRTIRLGVLQEQQLPGALQQILHRFGTTNNHSFIASEWQHTPKLTTAEKLLEAISNGNDLPGNIAEVSEQQCQDIIDSWQAFEPTGSFTLFWQGSTPPAEYSTRRVRAQLQGSSQFAPTQLVLRTFGNNNCPFPKAATTAKIPQDLATENRCFIRITAPQHFRQIFRSNSKPDEPSHILAEISSWQLPAATLGQLTGGEWQRLWTKQGNHIQGHIKVRNALAEQLLQKSGHKAIFFTKTGAREGQSKVQWHKRQQAETDEDYYRRVADLAGGSAIRFRTGGAADLGTDSDEVTNNGKRRAHYELQGSPAKWDDQDLISFLESNQWDVHKIHSKRKGYKGSTTWMLEATCPDNPDGSDSFFYDGDPFSIYIFPRAPSRRDNSYREPLWGPKQMWGTTKQQHPLHAEPTERPGKRPRTANRGEQPEAPAKDDKTTETQEKQAETTENLQQKKRDEPEPELNLALAPDPSNPEHIEHAIISGWQEKDIGGPGDCFFRSVIKAENHWHNKAESNEQIQKAALDLRLEAIKHIRRHYQQYAAAWVHDDIELQYQRAGQNPPKDFDDFLKQASKKSYWVNEHLIQAVSTRTGIPIVIWRAYTDDPEDKQNNSSDSKAGNKQQRGKRLWHRGVWAPAFEHGIATSNNKCKGIKLILRANHYTCVLPPEHEQSPPTPWLREVHSSHNRQWVAGGLRREQTTPTKPISRHVSSTPSQPKTQRWGMETPSKQLMETRAGCDRQVCHPIQIVGRSAARAPSLQGPEGHRTTALLQLPDGALLRLSRATYHDTPARLTQCWGLNTPAASMSTGSSTARWKQSNTTDHRPATASSIQTEWNAFLQCITNSYQQAVELAAQQANDHSARDIHRLARQANHNIAIKGLPAQHQTVSVARSQPPPATQTKEAARRSNRQLARCYEAKHLADNNKRRPAQLLRKLKGADSHQWSLQTISQMAQIRISELTAERHRHEEQCRSQRLQSWKQSVQTQQGLTKWIRSKSEILRGVHVQHDNATAETDQQAACMIAKFWTTFWNNHPNRDQDHAQVGATLATQILEG